MAGLDFTAVPFQLLGPEMGAVILEKACIAGGFNTPVLVPESELGDLLKSKSREMYEALGLKSKIAPGKTRAIWKDDNYRVDLGRTVQGKPHLNTWHLQVQRMAKSGAARELRGK
ncbi:uncharacterized protein DSM5745_07763 [Aspergillus mulundensis]|uniref:Uncharacterized protein n=1 Tax=Aspergillus mulundensis TaxID=1810919 RepID=A0A3D8RFE7_9EURO|nr:hypothetical protein DSM5745_07763 [Aspergillus mulundensis]RDW72591.1 hypothetical protein DSM5745_07763 [Aspergillus mulundensis]